MTSYIHKNERNGKKCPISFCNNSFSHSAYTHKHLNSNYHKKKRECNSSNFEYPIKCKKII